MSRSLTVYGHRADGQTALAAEITPRDVERGLGGRAGDFYVFTPGHHGAKWWERDTFLDQYEPLDSAKVDSDRYGELEGAIDDAHAAIAALEPTSVEQLTRETFAGVDAATSSPATGIPNAYADELEQLRGRVDTIDANLEAFIQRLNDLDTPRPSPAIDELSRRVDQLELRADHAISPDGLAGDIQQLRLQLEELSAKAGRKR